MSQHKDLKRLAVHRRFSLFRSLLSLEIFLFRIGIFKKRLNGKSILEWILQVSFQKINSLLTNLCYFSSLTVLWYIEGCDIMNKPKEENNQLVTNEFLFPEAQVFHWLHYAELTQCRTLWKARSREDCRAGNPHSVLTEMYLNANWIRTLFSLYTWN